MEKKRKVHRHELKLDEDMYELICRIAGEVFNAPIHHRSNKPQINDTVLNLIKLGIEHIQTAEDVNQIVDRYSNTDKGMSREQIKKLIDEQIQPVVDVVAKLEKKLVA